MWPIPLLFNTPQCSPPQKGGNAAKFCEYNSAISEYSCLTFLDLLGHITVWGSLLNRVILLSNLVWLIPLAVALLLSIPRFSPPKKGGIAANFFIRDIAMRANTLWDNFGHQSYFLSILEAGRFGARTNRLRGTSPTRLLGLSGKWDMCDNVASNILGILLYFAQL